MRCILPTLIALGCGPAWSPDDCRTVLDDERCEPYVPEGELCGLLHGGFSPQPGSTCRGHDQGWTPVPGAPPDPPGPVDCPKGWRRVRNLSDNESDSVSYRCVGIGNAESSSADLDEVPRHAACGIDSFHRGPFDSTCQGFRPARGEGCPPGFGLRFALDQYGPCGALPLLGHLIVWCELEDGCEGPACRGRLPDVCGLTWTGYSPERSDAERVRDALCRDGVSDRLRAQIERQLEQGVPDGGSCQGFDVRSNECPPEMTRACLPDRLGCSTNSATIPDALCWCAPTSEVRAPDELLATSYCAQEGTDTSPLDEVVCPPDADPCD